MNAEWWDFAERVLEMGERKKGGVFHLPGWFWDAACRKYGAVTRSGYLFGFRAQVDRNLAPDALRYVR